MYVTFTTHRIGIQYINMKALQHVFLDKMQTRHFNSLYRNNIVFIIYGPAVIYRVCMVIKYMCYCHKKSSKQYRQIIMWIYTRI